MYIKLLASDCHQKDKYKYSHTVYQGSPTLLLERLNF